MKRVYFLRPIGQLGPVKIGCSINPDARLDTFTLWSPTRLELICSVPGAYKEERTLHAMFGKHRAHGEWFGASKELLALIDHCLTTGELPELPKVLKFPSTRQVGFARRAKGVAEPRVLTGAKLELATMLRAQYESGLSASALAVEHGRAVTTIIRYIRAAGGTLRRGAPTRAEHGVADQGRANEWRERYLAGETLQQIGDDYGVTRERVRQVLRKVGVASLGHRPEHCRQIHDLTDVERRAAELYRDGMRPKEIIAATGVTHSQILAAVRRLGIEIKGNSIWNRRPDDAEITERTCDLYRRGFSVSEIVKHVPQLKYTSTVYRYLKKGGVPVRTKRGRFGPRAA